MRKKCFQIAWKVLSSVVKRVRRNVLQNMVTSLYDFLQCAITASVRVDVTPLHPRENAVASC